MATYMRTCHIYRQKLTTFACSLRLKQSRAATNSCFATKKLSCQYCHSSAFGKDGRKPLLSWRTLHHKNTFHNRVQTAHFLSSKGVFTPKQVLSSDKNDQNIARVFGFSNCSQCAYYSSSASGIQGSEGDGEDDPENKDAEPEVLQDEPPPAVNYPVGALTTLVIPEEFPNVPVIATNRFPIFPRFQKVIEASDLINCLLYFLYLHE